MEEKISFEEALEKLEKISELLNNPDTSLEDSIKLFEEGMQYSKKCSEILNNAKQKITELSYAAGETNGENND